jgi:predicted outer membrane repeat protein
MSSSFNSSGAMYESHNHALVDDCTVCEGSWLEYSQSFPLNLCKNFCQESNRPGYGALCHFLGDNVYSEGGLNYTFVLLPFLVLYIASWFILEMRGPKACIASIWKSGGRWFQAKDGWAGEMRPFGERLKHWIPFHPYQNTKKSKQCSEVKVSHICLIFWTCLVVVGGRSLGEVNVGDMNGLFNTVSNAVYSGANTGNSIMANGDTAILAVGSYKGSEGTCADSEIMLRTEDLNGEVKCVEDNASCVLDGENARRGMEVRGTGSGTLILRALTFDKGYAGWGGGVWIRYDAIVDLKLCIFSNNRATSSDYGGGAIYVSSSGGNIVNVYGTSFNGNTADSGDGDDIENNGGTITIHNTCPSPYSSNTPIQGKTRMRIV